MNFKRENLFIAVIIYFSFTLLLSIPFVFCNYTLIPVDFGNTMFYPFKGINQSISSQNHYTIDAYFQYIQYKALTLNSWKNFDFSYWNPYNFCGYPQYAETMATNFNPSNIFYTFLPFNLAWNIQIFLPIFISAFAMFSLLTHYKISYKISLLGGFAYSLNSMFISYITYHYMHNSFCWIPFLILYTERYLETRKINNFYLAILFMGLSHLGGNIQISSFIVFLFFIYFLFYPSEKFQNQFSKILIIFTIIFLSFLITSFKILPEFEHICNDLTKDISRFRGQQFQYNFIKRIFNIPFLISFFIPDIMGNYKGINLRTVIGAQPNDFQGFLGSIIFIYGIIGMFFFKTKYRKSLIAITLLSLGLPILTPLYKYLYDRFFIIYNFSFVVLASFGLNSLCNNENYKEKLTGIIKKFNIMYFLILSGFILFTIFSLIFHEILFEKLKNIILPLSSNSYFSNTNNTEWILKRVSYTIASYQLTTPEVFLSFILIGSSLFLTNTFFKSKISKEKYLNLLLILTIFQLLLNAYVYLPIVNQDKYKMYPKNELCTFLDTNTQYERIAVIRQSNKANAIFPSSFNIMYNLYSPEGYESISPQNPIRLYELGAMKRKVNPKLLGYLNIKYLLTEKSNLIYDSLLTYIGTMNNVNVYQNKALLDKVSILYKVKNSKNINIKNLLEKSTDFSTIYFSEKFDKILNIHDTTNSSEIIQYRNNYIKLKVYSGSEAYLRVADTYYNGWRAYVNKKETKIYNADFYYRGIKIPSGNSIVEFKFEPLVFKIGIILSILTILVLSVITFIINTKKN